MSAARWQRGAAAVAGPALGFLRLLNSTGGADAPWMGDSGQMCSPTVEGSSPGLSPRRCQFVPVCRLPDAGELHHRCRWKLSQWPHTRWSELQDDPEG